MAFARKFLRSHIWKRLFFERFTEPIHLNVLSLAVAVFGSFRQKVSFDVVIRPHNAYGLLKAADTAKRNGVVEITAIEFGVASGAGLMNMARIAQSVTKITGVCIRLVGFDTGMGMPPPLDYRDHPNLYGAGDFPMNFKQLRAALPQDVELVLGPLKETLPAWLQKNARNSPVGFVVLDVDYYSSAVEALNILKGSPDHYLQFVVMYIDDIMLEEHNSYCGELLAIREFNEENPRRKIERPEFIGNERAFKRAPWLHQMFFCHILDHPARSRSPIKSRVGNLENPYL